MATVKKVVKTPPARSNAGGALRGAERAAQVQALNAAKRPVAAVVTTPNATVAAKRKPR